MQAQALRDAWSHAVDAPRSGFAIVPDDEALRPVPAVETCWQEADLERAVAAAEQAGLTDYRVEMTPTGALAIIVGTPR